MWEPDGWDVSQVTDMSNLFGDCPTGDSWCGGGVVTTSEFNADISAWDTSQVTNMANMFSGASRVQPRHRIVGYRAGDEHGGTCSSGAAAFNQDIGSWNTAQVTNMGTCSMAPAAFNQDIGSVEYRAGHEHGCMFRNARAFNQDIGSWNTAQVTNMGGMFSTPAPSTKTSDRGIPRRSRTWGPCSIDASRVQPRHRIVEYRAGHEHGVMFNSAAAFNQDIGSWNTAQVTNMRTCS